MSVLSRCLGALLRPRFVSGPFARGAAAPGGTGAPPGAGPPGLLPAPGGPARLPGLALLGVVGLTLAIELGAPRALAWGMAVLLVLYGGALWSRMAMAARVLGGLALGLAALGLAAGALTRADLREAFYRAGFIGTLFAAFGFLRAAAVTSPTVRRCGLFLARRPPGWRYGALTAGAQTFGLILNFGVIPLLGAMVSEGTRAADTPEASDPLARDRARRDAVRRLRMAKAVHRGFAAVLAWSPLTVSLAVILTALPDLTWEEAAPWMVPYAAAFLALGWVLDRLSPIRRRVPPPPPGGGDGEDDGSWALTLPIVALVVGILIGGWGLGRLLDLRLVAAVMLLAPVIAGAWIWAQTAPAGLRTATTTTARRLGQHVRDVFPAYHTELGVVGASAFIGVVVAALLPADAVPRLLAALGWPAWGLVTAVPWVVVALGQIGFSPVLSVSLIAAAMPPPEVIGLPTPMLAVAYGGSWALVSASSPYTAAVLSSARVAASPLAPMTPWRFGVAENGVFTLCACAGLSLYCIFLYHVL